jgi:hypothetical protein
MTLRHAWWAVPLSLVLAEPSVAQSAAQTEAETLAQIQRELAALRAENAQIRSENQELRGKVDALVAASPGKAPPAPTAAALAAAPPPAAPPRAVAQSTAPSVQATVPVLPAQGAVSTPTAAAAQAPVVHSKIDFGPISNPTESGDPYASGQPVESYAAWAPGRGFKIADTPNAELNISAYILARYINQLPGDDTSFTDHLGREREIDPRRDIQLQRIMVWLGGWAFSHNFRYQTIFWTVNSTNQVAIAGSIVYHFAKQFELGTGINRLPGTYSMMGSHPYWYASDRVMADEFFRPGMTSGIWINGELLPRFYYMAMVGDNLSQLGINAAKLTRNNAYGAALWWMPTTGEFGQRGGFGDFEHHDRLATRFGVHYTHSREDRFNQASTASPDNTQIRLSDSTLFFETGSLAPGVTIDEANFDMWAANAGFKYKGWALHTEAYHRRLSNFLADGPLPLSEIKDNGFYVQGSYDILERKVQIYTGTSQIYGQFGDSSEYLIGVNWFPFGSRNLKVNAMVIDVNRSAVSSVFGYYVGRSGRDDPDAWRRFAVLNRAALALPPRP